MHARLVAELALVSDLKDEAAKGCEKLDIGISEGQTANVRARSADVLQCGSPWARAVKCGPFAQSKLLQRCATGPRDTSGSDASPRASRVGAVAALSQHM